MNESRFAQGPFHVGYERRVDLEALRAKRIAKADEERRKAGLDALLVWKDENWLRYGIVWVDWSFDLEIIFTISRDYAITRKNSILSGSRLIWLHRVVWLYHEYYPTLEL